VVKNSSDLRVFAVTLPYFGKFIVESEEPPFSAAAPDELSLKYLIRGDRRASAADEQAIRRYKAVDRAHRAAMTARCPTMINERLKRAGAGLGQPSPLTSRMTLCKSR
jgi:hypothetical protein